MVNEAIVLMNANDAENAEILQNSVGENRVFESSDHAVDWVESNAKVGWVTQIIEID